MINFNNDCPFPIRPLGELVEVLDKLRKPVNSAERAKRQGPYPYYGANGQVGTIDGYLFDEELVLVAEDGGFFKDPFRPISYRVSGKCWVNNHAHVLRPSNRIDVDWLNFSIAHQDITYLIKGSTRTKLNQKELKRIPVPLPIFNEQRRIVSRIKELLERVEEINSLQNRSLKESKYLFGNRCSELFNQNWPEKQLEQLLIGGPLNGVFKKRKDFGNGTLLVNVKDLYVDQTINVEKLERVKTTASETKKYELKSGDVLVNRSSLKREGLGRSCMFLECEEPVVFECHVMKIQLNQEILKPYLFAAFMNSPIGLSRILQKAKTATMSTWNQQDLKSMMIPVPPISQQEKMVDELIEFKGTSVSMSNELIKATEKGRLITETVLRKAFAGEL